MSEDNMWHYIVQLARKYWISALRLGDWWRRAILLKALLSQTAFDALETAYSTGKATNVAVVTARQLTSMINHLSTKQLIFLFQIFFQKHTQFSALSSHIAV